MKKNCRSLRERKEKKRERERLLRKCLWICFFWFSTLGHRAYSFWDKRKTCTIKTTNPTFSQAWSSMDVLIKYLLSPTGFFLSTLYLSVILFYSLSSTLSFWFLFSLLLPFFIWFTFSTALGTNSMLHMCLARTVQLRYIPNPKYCFMPDVDIGG